MIRARDLLVYAGGAALEKYGTLVRRVAAGQSSPLSVTRATAGMIVDRNGILRTVEAGVPRVSWLDLDGDGVLRPCLLVESARTQLATNPDTPASWTSLGSPVLTTGQTDPWGGTAALLVEDDDGAQAEGKYTGVTFSTSGTKILTFLVRAGTATVVGLGLYASNATTWRHLISVTWDGSNPPALATVQGTGTLFDPVAIVDANGTTWWLISFSVDSVVSTDTNEAWTMCGVTNAATGTYYLAGVNAFAALYPLSWQGGSLGTRNADALTVPLYVGADELLTAYAVLARPAHADYSGTLSVWPTVFGIAKYTARPNLGLHFDSPAREIRGAITGGSGGTATTDEAIVSGSRLSIALQYDPSTDKVRIHQGSAWSSWSSAASTAVGDRWGEAVLYLGDGGETPATVQLGGGLYALLIARGAHEPSAFDEWLP